MPNLTNNGITGLWLDGKPVRRASLGGKVFFEKHDYNLSVVSDKDILSYADGDSATLTATLTDYDDPVTGETVVFSCEVKSTMVDASGTHDFGGCFIVDSTNLPRGKILHIGDRSDYSLSLMNSTYYYNNVSVDIGGFISKQWYTSKIMIKDGRLFIESSNRWVEAIDISEIDVTLWEIPTETNVTVEEYFYETGVTDVNGECSVVYDSKGTGDLNIKVECPNCSLVTEIYVEDCDFTIIDDTKVSTSNRDTLFYQFEANNDFIITADYYPTDYWEWFMLDKYVDSTRTIMGVFSSSYDKSSNFGITNLGYNGWKNIMIKWENNTLTFKYNNTIVSKDVSAHEFPVNLGLTVNRANTRFKNFKLKKL